MRQETIDKLAQIVGQENCQVDTAIRRQHGYSETAIPDVVVYPETTEQVAQVVKTANDEGVPVVPWGAGTMAERGLLPLTGGIAVNLTRMNKVLEYDYENQTAYVEAGISLKDLQAVLKEKRLFWPVEPVEPEICTVGGCVATNAYGPSKLGYGDTKFHLLGLEAVTPTGDIIHAGGKTVKNVQDYDNTRFFTGSWGSLGIVTKVMLKLRPLPEKAKTVVLAFKDLAEATEAARLIRNETTPVAMELLDSVAVAIMEKAGYKVNGEGSAVIVKFSGFVEQVDAMADFVKEKFASAVVLDEAAGAAAWQARNQLYSTFAGDKGAILTGVALPFTKVGEFIIKARAELDKDMKGAAIISHYGNAQVHILFDEAPDNYSKIEALVNNLASIAGNLGGVLIVHNVTDMTLAQKWVESRGKAIFDIMRRLKNSIDPRLVMTPNSKVLAYVVNDARASS